MKKIDRLPDGLNLDEIAQKWIEVGLATGPCDEERIENAICRLYVAAGRKEPTIFLWQDSPLTGTVAAKMFAAMTQEGEVGEIIGDSVKDSVRDSVKDSVGASVRDSVGDSVWASVGDSVWASVWDSVWDSVGDSVRDSGYGQHDANWLGFYDYFNNVLKLETQTNALAGLWMIAQSAGWFLPHENICWISERHDVCKVNKEGKIHCDGGPAIHYPDGFSVWGLNGVRVSKEIAETSAENLDAKLVLTEKNAEVRREIVRKIGVDLLCQRLGSKTIESGLDHVGQPCQLINLDLGDGQFRPYVKLLNPSIGTYHIEGVSPECDTLEKAFNFRNGTKEKPVIVT